MKTPAWGISGQPREALLGEASAMAGSENETPAPAGNLATRKGLPAALSRTNTSARALQNQEPALWANQVASSIPKPALGCPRSFSPFPFPKELDMAEPSKEFSNISLNFNGTSRSNPNAPTLIGTASVVDTDGARTEFRVAAWGPKQAKTGGPDFYDADFTPTDPAAAARQVAQRRAKELGPVRNAIEGFEISEIGRGKIFERPADELAANPKQPKFWGHGLVQLASGPSYIDLSLWHRPASKEKGAGYNDFYSGTPRRTIPRRPPLRALRRLRPNHDSLQLPANSPCRLCPPRSPWPGQGPTTGQRTSCPLTRLAGLNGGCSPIHASTRCSPLPSVLGATNSASAPSCYSMAAAPTSRLA